MALRTAVVVTTYNSPKELAYCLQSLQMQDHQDFDLFIADDGSGEKTRDIIESFHRFFSQRLQHVWHEDHGYAKSEINNKVFRLLKNHQIVILVDGDTFLHEHFVADHQSVHKQHSGRKLMFMGRRVNLGPVFTRNLDERQRSSLQKGLSWKLLLSGLQGDSQNVLRAIRIESPFWRRFFKRDRVPDLLGSNFSISVPLLFEVNGYNEEYQNYWGEDGDLFVRVRNSGALILGSKSIAIQYHLHHEFRSPQRGHLQEYQKKLQDFTVKTCKKGIFQLE